MKVNNISFNYYKPTGRLPLIKQGKDVCSFSASVKPDADLTPTAQEIQGVIEHLPKDEQDAEQIAKSDVRDMASQVIRLVKSGEIKSKEDYREYMGVYTELGKKVFDKMTPEQKSRSIMLQEKSLEEMHNLKSVARLTLTDKFLLELVDVQIGMSQDTLQYCKGHS